MKLPFPPTTFSLTYNNRELHFALPADPDSLFNTITEQQYLKDRFLPYWAERWPSADLFFTFLMKQSLPAGYRIGELGCGLGVATCALAIKNHFVVATDIAFHGCCFASYNIAMNGGTPAVLCADWRHLPFRANTFDLIIASDILYEERWINPVLDCIDTFLTAEGKCWIADPSRRFWYLFKQAVAKRGFRQHIVDSGTTNDGKTTIEILEISRC
jgi:ETFB lysine methyltransferase